MGRKETGETPEKDRNMRRKEAKEGDKRGKEKERKQGGNSSKVPRKKHNVFWDFENRGGQGA